MQHMYFNVLLYIQTNEQGGSSDSTPGNFFLYIWNAIASYIDSALIFWGVYNIKLFLVRQE